MPTVNSAPLDRRWMVVLGFIVIVVAGWIRWVQVGERVAHVDEGVQAYQTWRLMDEGVYNYSPEDRHGPLLYFLSAGAMKLLGIPAAEMRMEDLRIFSAFWGLSLVALLVILGVGQREAGNVWGAALLAVVPFAVCYHNYYTQESFFAFLSFALLFLLAASRNRLSSARAVLIGVVLGLLVTTKETAVIHLFVLFVAWLFGGGVKQWRGAWNLRLFATTAVVAVFIWVLVMSQGFRRWDAVVDGLKATFFHFERAGNPAHAKPFLYYLSLFWPQFSGGLWWSQLGLLFAAGGGTFLLWTRRKRADLRPAWGFVAVFSWGLFFLYSVIPYKMPWLLLTPLTGFCLLGGYALAALFALPRARLGLVLGFTASALLGWESVRLWRPALFRYADDERNLYLYVHTQAGFARLEQRLDEILRLEPGARVAVIGADSAWPLPWHLRNQPAVGYFATIPDDLEGFDLVVLDSALAPSDDPGFLSGYVPEVHGLRPNILLLLYIREPLWGRFTSSSKNF